MARAVGEENGYLMLSSIPRQIVFLAIFTIGIGFMLTEGEIGQFDKIMPIAALFVLPPFILIFLTLNRHIWQSNKKACVVESLRDACLCTLVVTLFIPTINRILPPSTDYTVNGQIVDVKEGKGGISWGLKIRQTNGQNVSLTVPKPKFPDVTEGEHFELKIKRGGLGLLYAPPSR